MIQFHPILAVAFITPGFFIAGLALAALPIIIHILNRRRYKIVPWAAMEYLLAAMKKNRRRLKFEQWLLLLTRCAVLALLGLALARPLGCADSALSALAAERSGLHVFIIDNSYSMAYEAGRPDAKTHLEQARLIAKTIINRLSAGGESVAIITASAPSTAIIAHPTYDLEGAKNAIDRVEQSFAATDLAGAMQRAADLAAEESRQPVKKLYILSDSTRSAWEGPQAAAVKNLGPQLAKTYRITYFNLGRKDQWNQAALDVRPQNSLVTSKFNNDFAAIVKGFGPGPDATLQWKLDEQLLPGARGVHLDLDTPPQIQSSAILRSGGPHVISATLAGEDRLRIDNTRWRVIDVASELKVLIVEGDRGVGLMSGSAAYLALALAPPNQAGAAAKTDSPISPEVISDLELGNKVLTDYRAVILTNVGQVYAPQADALEKYVRGGGALLIYMGDQVNADSYNKMLLPRGLMPGALTKRMSVGSDQKGYLFDFKPEGDLHPLLQIFKHEPNSGLGTAQVFTYWQVDLPAASKVQRVLNYVSSDRADKPDPAITTHQLGDGHIVFISTSDSDWTTLPAKPVHIPLVHELLAGSIAPSDSWMNRTVGQALEIPSWIKLTSAPSLFDSSKKEVALEQTTTSQGQGLYRSRPLPHPGVYTLSTGERSYPVTVNVPAEEADVRTLDPAAVKTALGDIDISMEGDQAAVEVAKDISNRDFGWSFMVLVLALVAVECFLAMRFGHYRRTSK